MVSDSQHYQAFEAVVRTGNVTAAARELRVPRPTLSRRLARLEADLGVALLLRTTRRVTPTPAGQRLYERLQPLLEAFEALEQSVREEAVDVQGTLRISSLPLLAESLAPLVRALRLRHPRLTVEVVANVRLVDLRSEGYDIALWAGDLRDPDLIHRRLTYGRVGLVASPAYLAEHGTPRTVDDLGAHALLRGHSSSGRPRGWWPLLDGGQVRVEGHFVSNDHALLRCATLRGEGVCLLSDLTVADDLRQGRLVRVLEHTVGADVVLWVVFARRSPLPARVRAFLDAAPSYFDGMEPHPAEASGAPGYAGT